MSAVPTTFTAEPVRVRAPATSANLGPGFDALGLALALLRRRDRRGRRRRCPGGGDRAGRRRAAGRRPSTWSCAPCWPPSTARGARPPGWRVECVNRIPQARGLGSSSAAIVAGVLLARALVADGDAAARRRRARCGWPPRSRGTRTTWRRACSAGSPSPGPSRPAPGRCRWTGRRGVRPTVFVPAGTRADRDGAGGAAGDRAARGRRVQRRAGRRCWCTRSPRDPRCCSPATEDRLHQDYRAAGDAGTAALVGALRAAGVAAVVSGAGPTVLALTSRSPARLPSREQTGGRGQLADGRRRRPCRRGMAGTRRAGPCCRRSDELITL